MGMNATQPSAGESMPSSGAVALAPFEVMRVRVTKDMPESVVRDVDRLPTYGAVWSMVMQAGEITAEEVTQLVNEVRAENEELRREMKAMREELAALRDIKSQFAEVRARASESDAKVERLMFQLERIAADRRGEPGRDGEAGAPGPRGLRGEKGAMGERGIAGREISDWKTAGYTITPIMSDGRLGASCDLRPVLEQGYADALVTDDIVASEEYTEQRSREIRAEGVARLRGQS
jgi:hypothetical protein